MIAYEIDEVDKSLIDLIVKYSQLKMYKHFGEQIKRNGSLTYEQYTEQIEPAVELLRNEIESKHEGLEKMIDELRGRDDKE